MAVLLGTGQSGVLPPMQPTGAGIIVSVILIGLAIVEVRAGWPRSAPKHSSGTARAIIRTHSGKIR